MSNKIRNKIISHYQNNFGKGINYSSLGGYDLAEPVYEELWNEGVLVEVKLPSASGKRMMRKLVLRSQAEDRGLEIVAEHK